MKPEKLLKKYENLENDFEMLRTDYLRQQEELKESKKDLLRLLAILVEKNLTIPGDIADRHIQRGFNEMEQPFTW